MPSPHNWRTTDEDEINRRRAARPRRRSSASRTPTPRHPIFSNFRVRSGSGLTYSVEIRDVRQRQFACECVDFRINGLGTCKHVEAVLLHLQARFKRLFQAAAAERLARGSTSCPTRRSDSIRLLNGDGDRARAPLQAVVRRGRRSAQRLAGGGHRGAQAAWAGRELPELRLSQELGPGWKTGAAPPNASNSGANTS